MIPCSLEKSWSRTSTRFSANSHKKPSILLKQGWSKERILAERGAVIGVSDVSFSVEEGEFFVHMGLSGSGKSTLIRLINRLIEPTAGDVFIDGQNVAKLPKAQLIDLRRRDMSMVFHVLRPDALAHRAGQRRLRPGSGRQEQEGARASRHGSAGAGGLAPFAHKYPMNSPAACSSAWAWPAPWRVDPSMIIMDEAFSALDPLKRREMQDCCWSCRRPTAAPSSSSPTTSRKPWHRIAHRHLEGGKLVQVGTPQELIEKPANDYVRNFFDTVDTSRYLTAGQLKADSVPLYVHNGKAPDALQVCRELQAMDKHYAFIVDEDNRFRGSISLEKIALLVEDGRIRSLEPDLLKQIVPVPRTCHWTR